MTTEPQQKRCGGIRGIRQSCCGAVWSSDFGKVEYAMGKEKWLMQYSQMVKKAYYMMKDEVLFAKQSMNGLI